ncbi:MAG TPA: PE/PPE C-terminal domain-containing protein [Mycobacterium sp.]
MSLLPPSGGVNPGWVARLGRGTSIGTLSVPQAWATATTPSPLTSEALGEDFLVIEPSDLIW